jgi:hypothetical protein
MATVSNESSEDLVSVNEAAEVTVSEGDTSAGDDGAESDYYVSAAEGPRFDAPAAADPKALKESTKEIIATIAAWAATAPSNSEATEDDLSPAKPPSPEST